MRKIAGNCGKWWEHCGALTKPPEASKTPLHQHTRRGDGQTVIAEKMRKIAKNCGKWWEHCGSLTEPPEASRSTTSAQGTHRAPTHTQRNRGKIVENDGGLQKIVGKNAKSCEIVRTPPPPWQGASREGMARPIPRTPQPSWCHCRGQTGHQRPAGQTRVGNGAQLVPTEFRVRQGRILPSGRGCGSDC